jgi:GNAT superfamily N-acetyltransferase
MINVNKEISLIYKRINLSKKEDLDFLINNPNIQKEIFDLYKTNFLEPVFFTTKKQFVKKQFEINSIFYLVSDSRKNKILGFISGTDFGKPNEPKSFYLNYFAVDKKYQKKNIGTKLLFRTFADLRSRNYVSLDLYPLEGTTQILNKLVGKRSVYKNKLRKLSNNEYCLFKSNDETRIKINKKIKDHHQFR